MILDTRLFLETPEGASLPLTPAGIGVRILAFSLDILIKTLILMVIYIPLGLLGQLGTGLALLLAFLVEWFYPVYFECCHQGRTPGKMSQRIRVVHDDGTPISFAASLLRNLLRLVDFLPFFYVAGILCSLFNAHFKRIGDLVAGTLVIYDTEPLVTPQLDTQGQLPIPDDFNTDEQRALLAFAERSKRLSQERQEELALILQPLLNSKDPVKTIKQMANSLVGRR